MYLDESGFARDGPRTHGYCYRGKRCYGVHDWHAKGRINVIGAMVGFVLVSVGLFEGSINSDVFYAWLTQAYLLMLWWSWIMPVFINAPIWLKQLNNPALCLSFFRLIVQTLILSRKNGLRQRPFENASAVMLTPYFRYI